MEGSSFELLPIVEGHDLGPSKMVASRNVDAIKKKHVVEVPSPLPFALVCVEGFNLSFRAIAGHLRWAQVVSFY